ncbi:MAG: hypothetical protein KGD59_11005 [Candidatus Heimdallarchaeota archaeon]|nr:hypothetical protein [Candidatus Heimdallarchaeota archaeon]MBY8995069.1 hypothetical protein [Candidatus Heimdallarchaeota archaeon]
MPPKDDEFELFSAVEEGKIGELRLKLHKEEKKAKPPPPLWKVVVILFSIAIVAAALAIGLAKIIDNASTSSTRDFSDWIAIMLMILLGGAVFSGSIIGFWGGQRNIPIRMTSPSDASVVGIGMFVSGYVIEDCIDNELELTVYDKKKDTIYEKLIPINEDGLFYEELTEAFSETKKSENISVEAWMVSAKSTKIKFVTRKKKLDDLNVKKEGLKIGSLYFFSLIYKDFSDKVKAIFDPKRKEKKYIEKVKLDSGRTTNIFFPEKDKDDKFVPFSFEKVAEMRQNAIYFDISRKRRAFYSLIFLLLAFLYALYPIIDALIS